MFYGYHGPIPECDTLAGAAETQRGEEALQNQGMAGVGGSSRRSICGRGKQALTGAKSKGTSDRGISTDWGAAGLTSPCSSHTCLSSSLCSAEPGPQGLGAQQRWDRSQVGPGGHLPSLDKTLCPMGFPWWLIGKEPTCQSGDAGSVHGSGRSSGGENGNPPQYSSWGIP